MVRIKLEGRSKTIALVLFIVLLFISFGAFLAIVQMPIRASPDVMVLNGTDLPGWTQYGEIGFGGFGYGYSGDVVHPVADNITWFANLSNGFGLTIDVKEFGSSGEASGFYARLVEPQNNPGLLANHSVNHCDESSVIIWTGGVQNPKNLSEFLTGFFWYDDLRVDNVVVVMEFGEIAPPGATEHPAPTSLMAEVAATQAEKIRAQEWRFL